MQVKLSLIDSLFVLGFLTFIAFAGYHLYIKPDLFNPSGFGEGLMMMLFGHGAQKSVGVADRYFNSPEGDTNAK